MSRGWWNFWLLFFQKSAFSGQYRTLPQFTTLGPNRERVDGNKGQQTLYKQLTNFQLALQNLTCISHAIISSLHLLLCTHHFLKLSWPKCNTFNYLGQGIQEWTRWSLWKTAFKSFEVIWSAKHTSNLKVVFHKFYLDHSWIPWPK